MSAIKDGGPAYPVAENHHVADKFEWTCGMSLRDAFAIAALRGMGMWCPDAASRSGRPLDLDEMCRLRAEFAYKQADAMLAARQGGES